MAMIIKYPRVDKKEIYMIEAVGGPGVRLNKWSSLRNVVGQDKFYDKIAIRHVNFDRSWSKM